MCCPHLIVTLSPENTNNLKKTIMKKILLLLLLAFPVIAYSQTTGMKAPEKPTDAQVLGFSKGVKSVVFGFQAGFGYTYHFDRNGQLTAVVYTDHGDEGTLLMKNGQATQCDVVSEEYGAEEPTVPEYFHVTYSYQQLGDETIIYRTENQKQEQIGSMYYENGRISRIKSNGKQHTFMYNLEGRAFTQDGTEVYPPLFIFFSETPTLPRKHQVIKKDAKGRPLEAKASMEVESYSGNVTYRILYWNPDVLGTGD